MADKANRATSMSRVGRVRQIITDRTLVSEVDLEVGAMPGIPIKVGGTVVTSAKLAVVSDQKWELQVQNTKVKGSNIPIFNQLPEDNLQIELQVREFYSTVQGTVPVVPMTTLYVDESMRITRNMDENFFRFHQSIGWESRSFGRWSCRGVFQPMNG